MDGGSERLAHLPQSAGQLATRTEKGDVTRADTGRRTTGGRTGVRDAPLASFAVNPVRASEAAALLSALLALPGLALAVPCSHCCSALALSSASAFLPFVYVLLFIGRTRERPEQSREEKRRRRQLLQLAGCCCFSSHQLAFLPAALRLPSTPVLWRICYNSFLL